MKTINKKRIWEIDFLRGLAFFLMAYDHAIYDLNYILGVQTNVFNGYDRLIGDFSAFLFMVLCGVSASLSRRTFSHGLKVYMAACALTVITSLIDLFFNMGLTINFGILHMLGIALLICALAKKLSDKGILALCLFFLSFKFILSFSVKSVNYWLFPLGFRVYGFYSSDYYPIFPYVGFVLLGLYLGRTLYKEKKSLLPFSIPEKNPISFIGRHSLAFYLLHQPPLLALLWVITSVLRVVGIIQ